MYHLIPHGDRFGNVLPYVIANEYWKGAMILLENRPCLGHVPKAHIREQTITLLG